MVDLAYRSPAGKGGLVADRLHEIVAHHEAADLRCFAAGVEVAHDHQVGASLEHLAEEVELFLPRAPAERQVHAAEGEGFPGLAEAEHHGTASRRCRQLVVGYLGGLEAGEEAVAVAGDDADVAVHLPVPVGKVGTVGQVLGDVHETAAQAARVHFLQAHHVETREQGRDAVQVLHARPVGQHVFPSLGDIVTVACRVHTHLDVVAEQAEMLRQPVLVIAIPAGHGSLFLAIGECLLDEGVGDFKHLGSVLDAVAAIHHHGRHGADAITAHECGRAVCLGLYGEGIERFAELIHVHALSGEEGFDLLLCAQAFLLLVDGVEESAVNPVCFAHHLEGEEGLCMQVGHAAEHGGHVVEFHIVREFLAPLLNGGIEMLAVRAGVHEELDHLHLVAAANGWDRLDDVVIGSLFRFDGQRQCHVEREGEQNEHAYHLGVTPCFSVLCGTRPAGRGSLSQADIGVS